MRSHTGSPHNLDELQKLSKTVCQDRIEKFLFKNVSSLIYSQSCRYGQNDKCSATFELNKRYSLACILFKKKYLNFASNYKLLINILFWLCFTPSFLRKRMLRCAPCKTENHDHEMIFAFFPRNNTISCRLVRQGREPNNNNKTCCDCTQKISSMVALLLTNNEQVWLGSCVIRYPLEFELYFSHSNRYIRISRIFIS